MINHDDRIELAEETAMKKTDKKTEWNPRLAHLEYVVLNVKKNQWYAAEPHYTVAAQPSDNKSRVKDSKSSFTPSLEHAKRIPRSIAMQMFVDSCNNNKDFNYDVPVRVVDIVAAKMDLPES